MLSAWPVVPLLAALAGLAVAGATGRARLVQAGVPLVCLGFVLCALLALGQGEVAPVLLPFGPPWAPLSLGLDGLSAWFLLLLGLGGLLAGLAGWAAADAAPRRLMLWPLLLASMALALLAADAFGLLLGFALAGLAGHALLAAEGAWAAHPRAALRDLLALLVSAAALAVAVGLLSGLSGDLSFAGLRAAPPEAGPAVAVLLLLVAGLGARAVLPLLAPLPPGPALLLVAGLLPLVAVYGLARLLLDLGGPAPPLWWGLPLLLAGVALALAGALRALHQADLTRLLAGVALHHLGLVLVALGLVAPLRAADLGALAAVAGGAALLHLLAQLLVLGLLWLAAAEVAQGAGARHLDRLGGLIHAMPLVAWAALVGVAGAALLPPLAGFSSGWLLAQALFASWRVGALGFQILMVLALAVLGLALATLGAALLRFWALAFLGRPRTPRTLGAQEAAPLPRALLLGLAGLCLLAGLLPGPLLRLAAPALLQLTGHAGAPELGLLTVSAGPQAADLTPLAVGLLLPLLLALVGGVLRLASPHPARRVPPWEGGFAAPPPHLPFGDPEAQQGAAGLALALRPPLPGRPRRPGWWPIALPRWPLPPLAGAGTARRALRCALATLVVLLALLAWLGAGA